MTILAFQTLWCLLSTENHCSIHYFTFFWFTFTSLISLVSAEASAIQAVNPFSYIPHLVFATAAPFFPSLSSHSCVTLPAEWQEDEFSNLQQPGAGGRPTTPTAVPPAGTAAAGARRGRAASGLQAGWDSEGSPRGLPGFASRVWYGGAKDHASQRAGDPSFTLLPYNNECFCLKSPGCFRMTCIHCILPGKFRWAQAGGRRLFWECRFVTRLPLPTKRLCPNSRWDSACEVVKLFPRKASCANSVCHGDMRHRLRESPTSISP